MPRSWLTSRSRASSSLVSFIYSLFIRFRSVSHISSTILPMAYLSCSKCISLVWHPIEPSMHLLWSFNRIAQCPCMREWLPLSFSFQKGYLTIIICCVLRLAFYTLRHPRTESTGENRNAAIGRAVSATSYMHRTTPEPTCIYDVACYELMAFGFDSDALRTTEMRSVFTYSVCCVAHVHCVERAHSVQQTGLVHW